MKITRLQKGILLMVIGSCLFAVMALLIKLLSQRLDFIEIAFFRCLLSLPWLLLWLHLQKIPLKLKSRKMILLRSFIGWLAMVCNFFAIIQIGIADSAILNYTAPAWVFLISGFYLKEKIPPLYYLLFLIALAGVFMVLQPHLFVFNWGGIVGLISGVLVGMVYLMIKVLSKTEKAEVIVFYFTVFATLFYLPFIHLNWTWPTFYEWLLLGLMALTATLAQIFLTRAYFYGKASTISMYNFSSVIASAVLGVLFLGELLSFNILMGMLLIVFSGVYLSQHEEKWVKKIIS